MTPEQFAYWLQGYAELCGTVPTSEQWQSIRDHLALVFNKVTPAVMPNSIPLPYTGPFGPAICSTDGVVGATSTGVTYC